MSLPEATWRLIRHSPQRGAWNMAVDEAILEAVGHGKSLPTLRFYAWAPPCLSLGYAQPLADVDTNALSRLGWDIVRRPTGGRAILHTDELTYSVIGPNDEPRLAGGVLESYNILSRALLRGLHALQIPAEAVEQLQAVSPSENSGRASKNQNPVCFEVPSNYEITLDGKKLIGSAQARRKEGVLQHGSLPLTGDLTRILWGLKFSDDRARQHAGERLLARATTVEKGTNVLLDWEAAADAMSKAFSETLELKLIPDDISDDESKRAEELIYEKYANIAWTGKI